MKPWPIRRGDDGLVSLLGGTLTSTAFAGTVYQLNESLGAGGMSVAIMALRRSPYGETATVIKFLKPSFFLARQDIARVAVEKEAASLKRLNERVPSTPFVVRLVDAGVLPVTFEQGLQLDMPWLALEYVHGGPDGTTLTDRVITSVKWSGVAFDRERAMRLVECLSEGISAIHEMDVIHRDLKPDNILCCGVGAEEIFKVSDFGVARPTGVAVTFSGLVVGTPGYAAPEQGDADEENLSPAADVFSMAAIVFHALTGEKYFPDESPLKGLSINTKSRRKLAECAHLDPDLRDRPAVCAELDAIFARATSIRADQRPPSARRLASELAPYLRSDPNRRSPSKRPSPPGISSYTAQDLMEEADRLRPEWFVRAPLGSRTKVRSVAWSSDGTCLASSEDGVAFWDGTRWNPVKFSGRLLPEAVRLIQTLAPGRWLLAGEKAQLAEFSSTGVQNVLGLADRSLTFLHASGDLSDLIVMVAQATGGPPWLYAMSGRRWIRPVALEGVANVSSLVRLADTRWLVTGRSIHGLAYAAVYDPLMFQVHPLDAPRTREFLAAAANHSQQVAVMAGTDGIVAWFQDDSMSYEKIPTDRPVSAVAVDMGLMAWAATPGSLWARRAASTEQRWACVWEKPVWEAPFVSIHALAGQVIAMTADGGIVEGRSASGW